LQKNDKKDILERKHESSIKIARRSCICDATCKRVSFD